MPNATLLCLQDLEKLISKAVDPAKADYAVFTGVQIHNWSDRFEDDEPNLEFIMPGKAYVVIQGKQTAIDLNSISVMRDLSPMQCYIFAHLSFVATCVCQQHSITLPAVVRKKSANTNLPFFLNVPAPDVVTPKYLVS